MKELLLAHVRLGPAAKGSLLAVLTCAPMLAFAQTYPENPIFGGLTPQSPLGFARGGTGTAAGALANLGGVPATNPAVTGMLTAPISNINGAVSAAAFGAECNGTTDDSTAFQNWWAYITTNHVTGIIPAGDCKINENVVWNMSTSPGGVTVRGVTQNSSVLDLTGVTSGVPFELTGGGIALFYGHFSDFTILTNIAGVGAEFGAVPRGSTFSDAMNGFTFMQMQVKNEADNESAVALELNGVYNSDFQTVMTNTGGGSTTDVGLGTSLEIQEAQFSRFMGSFSSANIGVYLTNGYSFGNVFDDPDIENTNIGVQIDSADAAKNTFIGGTYAAYDDFNFTAGNSNVVLNPNASPYRGGSVTSGVTGLWLERPGVGVPTPSVPASGTAVTNRTGSLVLVVLYGGTMSEVASSAGTFAVTGGSFLMKPGDTITLTYTTAPGWTWEPIF
jgi:hypothetical protein